MLLLTSSQFVSSNTSFSFPTLQFDPAETRQPVLPRARSRCLSRGSGKGWRGGHWLSLAAVKGFLVQLHTSSSVGGRRRSDDDLRVVRLGSHALRFCVCQQRCVSPGTHLTARQRREQPAFSSDGFTSCGKEPRDDKSASPSGVCSHLSILVFPAAEKVALIRGGGFVLSKMLLQSPLPVEGFLQSAEVFASVFTASQPVASRGPELTISSEHNGCPVIQTRSSALNVHDFKSPELHFFKCVSLFFLPCTLKRKTGLKTLTSAVY